MAALRSLSGLLHDLLQVDRSPGRDERIVEALARHTPFRPLGLYLREHRDAPQRLAARTGSDDLPDSLDAEPEGYLLIPLENNREHLGALVFGRGITHDDHDLELARSAAALLATVLANHRLLQEMREGDFQLKYRLWELESLYDIGLSIASTLNIDELADEILFRMISLTNAGRAAFFLREDGGLRAFRSFGEPEIPTALVEKLMAEGTSIGNEGTLVALPISGNNAVIGVLAAADRETRGGVAAFDENDLRLLSSFASQVGIALENARLHKAALEKQAMERELELAATIQRDILPKSIPKVEGIELAVLALPARQVGGDYHAFFEREGVLTIVVADVAGKSMPAALLVSALHAAMHLLFEEGRDIGEIATELNKHIHRWSAENKFVTMIMVSIDRESETMRFVNAGHNPGYIMTGGTIETLNSHGLPVGIMSQSRYAAQARPFPAGSLVLLYSDGITEAENVAGEEFENDRLEKLLLDDPSASPESLRDRIATAVEEFVGEAPQKDDQTMVIARS